MKIISQRFSLRRFFSVCRFSDKGFSGYFAAVLRLTTPDGQAVPTMVWYVWIWCCTIPTPKESKLPRIGRSESSAIHRQYYSGPNLHDPQSHSRLLILLPYRSQATPLRICTFKIDRFSIPPNTGKDRSLQQRKKSRNVPNYRSMDISHQYLVVVSVH